MFGLGLAFILNSLCAIHENICIPLNDPVKPESPSSSSFIIENHNRHSKYLSLVVDDNINDNDLTQTQSNSNEKWWTNQLPIIETKYGLIEGYQMFTLHNRSIVGFEGIRYATPPLGHLRFRAPVPITRPWSGIQKATRIRHACLQMDATQFYRIYGHEDCLFINIYTPMLPNPKKPDKFKLLPVLFFIHGGGHFFGTSGLYGPSYLLDTQDVILVTFNYRLGVLGFLSTGDSASPGNNALKDQALAIEWVQQNIEKFGGDPNLITLMGQSAGSGCVGLHLLSHKTRDIPVGAIMHSGDPLTLWGLRNITFESTKLIAQRSRCPIDNSQRLVSCLRKLNANKLVQKQFEIFKRLTFPLVTFGPIVEHSHPDAFLIESPEMAYARGNVSHVPVLQGLVPNEGDFMSAISYLLQYYRVFNRDFESLVPLALEFDNKPASEIKQIIKTLDDEYFPKHEAFTFWTRDHIGQVFGDRYFTQGVRKALEWHSKLSPTYGFIFDYKGKYSSLEALALRSSDWGISHIDDLQYIFNSTLFFKALTTKDKDYPMVEFVTNVWGNFIYKQKPYYTNSQGQDIEFWSSISPDSSVPIVLRLNHELYKSKMIPFPYEKRYQLWRSFKLKDDTDVIVNHGEIRTK